MESVAFVDYFQLSCAMPDCGTLIDLGPRRTVLDSMAANLVQVRACGKGKMREQNSSCLVSPEHHPVPQPQLM